MANYLIILFLATVAFAAAKPVPDSEGGQEILKGADTRYYGLPLFWYQRPFRGSDGDDYSANDGGYIRPSYRRRENKIPAYESVGAGWGR